MSDYIIPDSFRKPMLDMNRRFYPMCAHMSDDEFERFLLALPNIDEEKEDGR